MPGNSELLIILAIGLLLFGKRLPEVGRSLGKGIVEFKRGLKGIEEEIDQESSKNGSRPREIPEQQAQSLPVGDARRVAQGQPLEQANPSVGPTSNG
ncbi:MAG: twin-arginine translocase TatA/TatE family subunit [Phycisphaerales bacterium]|nr:twin-arginine translocase TatA/TatE family subunit [Phycisphaerales bacterium]